MDRKEAYCSECLKRCDICPVYENPIKAISKIYCLLLLFGDKRYQRQEYSMCCNKKVIYLNIKERILIAL